MNNEINQEIARRLFAALILENEYPAVDGLPALVVCRVEIDKYFHSRFYANSRAAAIEHFNNTDWRF